MSNVCIDMKVVIDPCTRVKMHRKARFSPMFATFWAELKPHGDE